jgi:hypothetical protein
MLDLPPLAGYTVPGAHPDNPEDTMPVNISCHTCNTAFTLPESALGAQFQCDNCGAALVIPAPVGRPSEPQEESNWQATIAVTCVALVLVCVAVGVGEWLSSARDDRPPATVGPAATAAPTPTPTLLATAAGAFGTLVFLTLATLVYLLPSIVASVRNHHNAAAICILNLLLGCTFIGWVMALVWSATEVRKQGHPQQQ